jgi:glycosyltransferase involved in cell wall biosynthesis
MAAIVLASLVLLANAALMSYVWWGRKKIAYLRDVAPTNQVLPAKRPTVSIIVPALNEANTIEVALRSILSIDYPAVQVIAINDRSTDATAAVLSQLQRQYAQLQVVNIENLPSGWLGKCHALHVGALHAKGQYLLFTDADVQFDSTALSRALAICNAHALDHLTLVFGLTSKGYLLRLLLVSLGLGLFIRFRPWLASDPNSSAAMGVGAFNLVRRSVYDAIGGHQGLKLSVLDDVSLGQRIKQQGFKQQVMYGDDLVQLSWYDSTTALFKGVEKNAFAALDFRVSQLVVLTAVTTLLTVWPWLALLVTGGAVQAIYVTNAFFMLIAFGLFLRINRWSCFSLVYLPVLGLVQLAMLWNSALRVLKRGGINWRGTFYDLSCLRAAVANQHNRLQSK